MSNLLTREEYRHLRTLHADLKRQIKRSKKGSARRKELKRQLTHVQSELNSHVGGKHG